MNEKRLNDELTVVGLVLILMFISYYLITISIEANKVYKEFKYAKVLAIKLNNRLETAEKQIVQLEKENEELSHMEEIVKDIATSWNSGRKD